VLYVSPEKRKAVGNSNQVVISQWLAKQAVPILSPHAAWDYAADPAAATAATKRLMTLSAAKSWLALGADYKRQVRVSPRVGKIPHMP